MSSLTLGLVGFGNIARGICEMALALKLNLIACDPFVAQEVFEQLGVERVALEELCARADPWNAVNKRQLENRAKTMERG